MWLRFGSLPFGACMYCALMLLSAPARALDSSGLGDPYCWTYVFSAIKFDGGKATGPDTVEYALSGRGQAGGDHRGCPGAGAGDIVSKYPVSVAASWNAKTGQARERISHGAPPQAVTEIVAQCPADPWSGTPACTQVSQQTTGADGKALSYFHYDGSVPMSAVLLGASGRALVGRAVPPYQAFVLPPNTAPLIRAPAADEILRRGQALRLDIQRPADGSDSWYAANKLVFDLEWEVKAGPGGAGSDPKKGLAAMWTRHAVLASTEPGAIPVTLANAAFYSGDTSGYAVEGGWNLWRVRVRLHDNVAVRPWSPWTNFFSEPPLRVSGTAPAVDKLGTAPAVKVTPPKPAGPAPLPATKIH